MYNLMLPSGNTKDLPNIKADLKKAKLSYVFIEYKSGGFLIWISDDGFKKCKGQLGGFPVHKYPKTDSIIGDMFIGKVVNITTMENVNF